MPSRDKGHIIRSPSFKSKLSQVQGLAVDEKALLVRIGNLLDFLTYSQRQESNPNIRARKKSERVPTPQNLRVIGITGGFIVQWDPVDFKDLSFYQLDIDSRSNFSNPLSFELIDNKFTYKDETDSTLFIRVRTVSKKGEVSSYSSTATLTIESVSIELDSDHVNFENRTTVEPKPTLSTGELSISPGDQMFVGVGGSVIGSPLTMEDRHEGFPNNSLRKNEITYDLLEREDPCTSLGSRIMGLPDNFIERSNFYTLEVPGTTGQAFYYNTFIYSGSFVDFFPITELSGDSNSIDVEFLRYRIANDFYHPDYGQTGAILEGTMGVIKL